MKKLKLLFNVSEAALTAAVFVLVTALVPMDIILKLVSQSVINGNPCLTFRRKRDFLKLRVADIFASAFLKRKPT